jgi:signal transduction histidine kinase
MDFIDASSAGRRNVESPTAPVEGPWYKRLVADERDDEDDLAFVTRHLAEMSRTMPELLARLGVAARMRGAELPPLPAPAEGGARLEAFVAYLERFGRPDESPAAPHSLEAILRDVVALVRPELERRAVVVERYAEAPPVFGAARPLAQLFLNLVVNAAQAIAEGDAAGNRIELRLATDARGWACVDIEDTGSGIADDVLPKIFEPHFSTKRGAGKGLGLSFGKQIVGELGGELRVDTAVGRGTRFTVALPPARNP